MFSRPVRWVMALHGDLVVPFCFAGNTRYVYLATLEYPRFLIKYFAYRYLPLAVGISILFLNEILVFFNICFVFKMQWKCFFWTSQHCFSNTVGMNLVCTVVDSSIGIFGSHALNVHFMVLLAGRYCRVLWRYYEECWNQYWDWGMPFIYSSLTIVSTFSFFCNFQQDGQFFFF